MGNKVLYCATVDYHFKAFHLPYMKWFKEQGWEVEVAAAGKMDLPYTRLRYNIAIERSPFHWSNYKAYRQLKKIIEQNNYDIIHCHTPLGGVLARLAARKKRTEGTKVIYTAHGFHFFSGAPYLNWLIYYPIEKYLSKHTDYLITINGEDFNLALNHRFKADHIKRIHGVGIDTKKFKPLGENEKIRLKKSFGYKRNDFLLFYAAEFNKNKNQQFLIQTLTFMKDKIQNVKLLLAGEGLLMESCRRLAKKLEVSHMVNFLGFRKDIDQFLPMCDLALAPSYREGLPVHVMEAMACEVPVVAVDNRGNRELVKTNETGWLLKDFNHRDFAEKIVHLANAPDVKRQLGKQARKTIIDHYSASKVLMEKIRIYEACMEGKEEALWAAH